LGRVNGRGKGQREVVESGARKGGECRNLTCWKPNLHGRSRKPGLVRRVLRAQQTARLVVSHPSLALVKTQRYLSSIRQDWLHLSCRLRLPHEPRRVITSEQACNGRLSALASKAQTFPPHEKSRPLRRIQHNVTRSLTSLPERTLLLGWSRSRTRRRGRGAERLSLTRRSVARGAWLSW
jgi:hypothetical protein